MRKGAKKNPRNSQKPNSVALVSRKTSNKIPRTLNASGSSYLRLLANPFDESAYGAKVADPASRYTVGYKITNTMKVTTPSGVTSCAYRITPNPFLTVTDIQAWSGGTSTSTLGSWGSNTANTYMYPMCTPTGIGNIMSSYRVVSHGIRIRLQIPQMTCTGRIYIARAPRSKPDPGYIDTNALTYDWAYQTRVSNFMGAIPPNPLANSPALNEMPEALSFSMADLLENDLILVNRPSSYNAFSFSQPLIGSEVTSAYREANDVLVNASGAIFTAGSTDNPTGWDDFYIYCDNVPASSPILDIQVMIHLEGTPSLSTVASVVPVPSTPKTSGRLIPWDTIMNVVNRIPDVVTTITNHPFARGNSVAAAASIMAGSHSSLRRITL